MYSQFSPNLAGVSVSFYVPIVLKKGITSNFNIGDLGFSVKAPWSIFPKKRLSIFIVSTQARNGSVEKTFNSCHMVEMQLKGSPFKKLLQSRFNYFLTPPSCIALLYSSNSFLSRQFRQMLFSPNPNSNCYMHKSILLL